MRILRRGDSGPEVARWQGILGIAADGQFGPATESATKEWQKAHGLHAVDGVVGAVSWAVAGVAKTDPPPSPITLAQGTDVSAVQGDVPDGDWEKMAAVGCRFAIMRLVVGNEKWTDAGVAKRNAERARAHGIACGAYYFPYPLPHLDPKQQVERFVSALEGVGSALGDLPPAIDAEWPPPEEYKLQEDGSKRLVDVWAKWKCSPAQLRDWVMAALARGEELTGQPWLVYSYRYWLRRVEMEKVPEIATRPLWLADYTYQGRWPSAEEVSRLRAPAPWSGVTILQHDGTGGLRLPSGRDADFNVLLGGEDRLAQLCSIESPAAGFELDFDLAIARSEATGLAVEEGIAAYRRDRLDPA